MASTLVCARTPLTKSRKERMQRAKKVVTDSQGLVHFAIGLVNSVMNLPDGQVKVFEEFKLQRNCEINLLIKAFLVVVEMMLVNGNLKMTFFAPWTACSLLAGYIKHNHFSSYQDV